MALYAVHAHAIFGPMTRRVRLPAGILTLAALLFSMAEAVVASTCAPMLEQGMGAVADPEEPRAMDCMPTAEGELPGPDSEGPPHCPFGPMTLAQGCAAAASLPAPAVFVAESPSAVLGPVSFDHTRHEILLATVLFHPPKA